MPIFFHVSKKWDFFWNAFGDYANCMLSDDKNRVILDIDADGSDYINASFIDVSFAGSCVKR